MEWLNITGTVASIGSAIWAMVEARKASRSASAAEQLRNDLIDRRAIVEISQIYNETRRILRVVSSVGPSCNPTLLRGVNCGHIAREVDEYCRLLNEQHAHFTEAFENHATKLCESLRPDIEILSEAKVFDEKKAAGKRIYYSIDSFMPTVKAIVDDRRERPRQVSL